MPDVIRIRT